MKLRQVIAALALCVVGTVIAAPLPPTIAAVQNGYRVGFGSNGTPLAIGTRTFSAGATAGEAAILDLFTGRGPVGRTIPGVSAARAVPWSSVAAGAARILPVAGVAWSAYEAATLARCYMLTGDAFNCDLGTNPVSSAGYSCTNGNAYTGVGLTPIAACEKWCQNWSTGVAPTTIACRFVAQGSNGTQFATYIRVNGGAESQVGAATATSGPTIVGCPASIDALNPAYNVPAGLPVGPDGKCATARYNHTPSSEAQVAERIRLYGDKTKARFIAQEVDQQGVPLQSPAPTVTGPASIPGPTVTTTPATGPATTQHTTYNITYQGDTYTWAPVTTTTTGDQTSVTEGEPDPTDPCEADPDRVGCQKLSLPDDPGITATTRTITYTADNLGFGSGCPAPRNFMFHGWALPLDYTPLCNVAPTIRLGLIAITALGCILIIIGVTRS